MSPAQIPGPIAVIDVETTGLFPFRHDRVIEVAVVVTQGDGQIEREFVSLVNPLRDIGPSSVHGITSEDILRAPQFGEIASHLVDILSGTVALAGHNVRFDQQFLESEFSRINYPLSEFFSICTMRLAGGGRLVECCGNHGISLMEGSHNALADARATAQLLANLLCDQPRVVSELDELVPIQWPKVPQSGKQPVTRDESRLRQSEPPTYLQRLLGRMHEKSFPIASDGLVMAYTALLDRVLEDRRVDDTEGDALFETATLWGLSVDQILLAHRDYLNKLALAALADGIITDLERRDLKLVSRLLGHEQPNLDEVLNEASTMMEKSLIKLPPAKFAESSLSGLRVCFTGEMQCSHKGRAISREYADELAAKAGLDVVDSVTKKLDLLVVADPQTQSGKAKKARQYGIRIMHESVFWKALGVEVN